MIRFADNDPRIDAVVDLLMGYPQGLDQASVVRRMPDLNRWSVREAMRVGLATGRMVKIHTGERAVLWTVGLHAAKLKAHYLEQSRQRAKARRRRNHVTHQGRLKAGTAGERPIVQRVVTTWAPVRQAPGPISIFDLGTF